MKAVTLLLCTLLPFFSSVLCQEELHWVLLVAGSNGYYNYRHQADICHAYHVVRSHGIPDERIVVMMYDDIANNEENPVPGNIINRPEGPNVYQGVPKDYTGKEVTPDIFLKVLTGDSEGVKAVLGRDGKVIKSGPNDRVFVNFADHGAPGFLAFPTDMLKAQDLHKAIKSMHKNKQYKQMVFYVEACESGSMFDNLLESDINVFATTAANPDESSYACYYDDKRQTYLGDVYSVMWMEDSDKENLKSETLQSQFKIVKSETNTSHVMEYGDLSLGKLKVADFQGNYTKSSLLFTPDRKMHPTADAVPSEDVALEILKRKVATASGDAGIRHRAALHGLLKKKEQTQEFFKNVVGLVTESHLYSYLIAAPLKFSDFSCYTESIRLIREMCPGMNLVQNDYGLRQLRVLANLCESQVQSETIWAAIGKVSYESNFCYA
ncbi:legumain [Aplysia californica]|uniref:Legumain n=1 Tax=Aplysia californica TaxID=6500 RepID=A0ABM0JUL4_APLCA|nr:legumain [Aplysia californica]